ncbi:glycosyltransferase family 2 protein [Haloarculaceae archaeon H-GB2-1]|nr:glycosyltransferase family 2 protein [Haloarculaceae archaeon H-GB1-1]MEA5388519.1 glycosyltransferase family 2 protein [Haloarculaceae archaeon H-GB11]MEA5406550.1 glycosyltransferase family 2 protein [Haloarculaceae archaeon H-GB2-1]
MDNAGEKATEVEENRSRSVLAIIPAHNEADTICEVIREAKEYVDDVIVIDDASTDDTRDVAKNVAAGVITHPKNMGVGGAVHTGYQVAISDNYDVVVQLDADGQHDPSHIPTMLTRLEEDGTDMVIGSRWLNESYKDYSVVRRAGISFFTYEVNLLGGLDITDVTSGYRAYDVDMLEDLGRPENSHWALEQTLEAARKGYSIDEISVPMPPETDGSQFTLETFIKYPPRMALTSLKVLLFR